MLHDRERLGRRAARPRLVSLHRALGRLRSTVTVMNTGAHPDDEQNGMLAVLRHQFGMHIVVACSTRGEGGQNILGPERHGALGVMRSREMEEAARVIDADIAWLGHGPDDPVHDFGFSKSGPDTLARWGKQRTLERLVRAYRQFRPDIVIPTFLDVPGQHGHHRAMTQAAEEALALAADPAAFPEHAAEGLMPWRVAKYYLPAWSGGGNGYYDDEVPPPAMTTEVVANGTDAATGMSHDRLGEVSRAFHASQNMGHWRSEQTRWPLHLVGGGAEESVLAGLPQRLADLGSSPHFAQADAALAQALEQFPHGDGILNALSEARAAIKTALQDCDAETKSRHGHRLERKLREIERAMALAAGIDVASCLSADGVTPGRTTELIVDIEPGQAERVTVTPTTKAPFLPVPSQVFAGDPLRFAIAADGDAAPRNAYRPDWQSLGGNGEVFLKVEAVVGGEAIAVAFDTDEDIEIAPAASVAIAPDALILPLPATGRFDISIKSNAADRHIQLTPLAGLDATTTATGLALTASAALQAGRHDLAVTVDGRPAYSVTPISYPHIGRSRHVSPLSLRVLALDLDLPRTRVGYVGGGSDRVGTWLERMGADVTDLGPDALSGDLSTFDTIVIGIFAFGARPDLAAATGRLRDWVEAGGHLVTLYHRPSDGWTPGSTPPRPLTIGSPSLRWRVTNPAAPVTILVPDHPLLAGPNRITAADFDGWNKERGLYFASGWDAAYQPLLSMSDTGEEPLTGSLLSGRIGKGRHTHTSLVLHHQLDHLVPGAFRLMANLLQPA